MSATESNNLPLWVQDRDKVIDGQYKEHAPTGEMVEIIGMSLARVTDDLKIVSLEHYFDNGLFLKKLTSDTK